MNLSFDGSADNIFEKTLVDSLANDNILAKNNKNSNNNNSSKKTQNRQVLDNSHDGPWNGHRRVISNFNSRYLLIDREFRRWNGEETRRGSEQVLVPKQ